MIEFWLPEKRKARMMSLTEIVEPNSMIREVLSFDGRILIPVRYATALYDWLRTGHVKLGLGFHDILWKTETSLDKSLYSLRVHPAMNGHGMLGRRNTLPMSCWMHEQHDGIPYCNIDGVGTEGFLVPQDTRFDGSGDHYTFWSFISLPHGPPRPRHSMFIPSFRNEHPHEKDSFAAKKAAERKTKYGN